MVHTGHPRVGGEQQVLTGLDPARSEMTAGSSPRGRGTATRCRRERSLSRVIPAWAGNRCQSASFPGTPAGHPRVGGEQKSCRRCASSNAGSSPRGRGTESVHVATLFESRVIPAWAGNRAWTRCLEYLRAGHPRVGGEQLFCRHLQKRDIGSSPRGRGTGPPGIPPTCSGRVIPAWAGNRKTPIFRPVQPPGHPRVGGEQCAALDAHDRDAGSSPRGRGTGHGSKQQRY